MSQVTSIYQARRAVTRIPIMKRPHVELPLLTSALPADFLSSKNVTALRCIRHRDVLKQRYERMAYFGPMCASEVDLPLHSDASFMEWAAGFNEKLLEDLQRQQAESLQPDSPGQMPTVGSTSFREVL